MMALYIFVEDVGRFILWFLVLNKHILRNLVPEQQPACPDLGGYSLESYFYSRFEESACISGSDAVYSYAHSFSTRKIFC